MANFNTQLLRQQTYKLQNVIKEQTCYKDSETHHVLI